MEWHAGMGVSVEETVICIVDETGATVKEMRATGGLEALADALCAAGLAVERVGREACSLTAWLHDEIVPVGTMGAAVPLRASDAATRIADAASPCAEVYGPRLIATT